MRVLATLLMSALVLLAAPALAQAAWTRFSYPEAGFSAEFPKEPRFSLAADDGGAMTDRRTYMVEAGDHALMVLSVKTATLTLEALKVITTQATAMDGRTLISQKTVTLQDATGLETLLRTKEGNLILHRIFYRDGRLLQFLVIFGPRTDPETIGRKFHSSVTLLPG